jgi:transcriptional regulator with GAF, ATPase, and Fis domain
MLRLQWAALDGDGCVIERKIPEQMTDASFTLTVRQGARSFSHTFSKPEVVMGRGKDVDLRLDDRLVSRRHCRIERQDGRYWLFDEGAQNRVKLRGQPVEHAELKSGDVILVGSCEVTFALASAESHGGEDTALGEDGRDAQSLRAFIEIARELNQERDLARLLTRIVDSAIHLTGAERGFLILGRGAETSVEVARNFAQEEVLSPEFKISRTIASRVLETGVAELTTNAQEDDRFRDLHSVADLKLRSVICVPIKSRSEVAGVLYVDNRLLNYAFEERERDLLRSFADQAGIAIHNARTMDELQRKQAELQAAHDRVAELNAALKGQLAEQTAELSEIRAELNATDRSARFRFDYREIIGESRPMLELFRLLDKYIPTEDPVLVLGESGTGKELVARAVHRLSRRGKGPFISENCAALPDNLLESELFGYRRGAFTGAVQNKKGLFELADGGVLFLDEVGDMPLELQKKLLRVLEEREVRPLGATESVKIDVRLIAATNRNLEEMVREGDFRGDLYYRLNVLPVHVPPLRERRDDIPRLVHRFLLELAREHKRRVRVSPDAMVALSKHKWPGNVRELYNEIRRACLLSDGVIMESHLSDKVKSSEAFDRGEEPVPAERGTSLPDIVRDLEVAEITRAMTKASGNKSRAAQMLGLSRFALQRKLDKYGLEPEGDGAAPATPTDADPE